MAEEKKNILLWKVDTKHKIKTIQIVQDLIVNKGHWVGEKEYVMKVICVGSW